jgi:hypothetical protein
MSDLSSSTEHFDIARELGSKTISLNLQVVRSLEVQPEARRVPKKATKTQGCIGANGTLPMNDLVDSTRGHLQSLRKAVLRERQGLQEFFFQDFTRMNGSKSFSRHWALLVIVDDLHVEGIGSDPAKANPPLIVDADAVLPETISGELLQMVCRRNLEVGEARGSIQHDKLAKCDAKEIRRKPANPFPTEQPSGVRVAKAADHDA